MKQERITNKDLENMLENLKNVFQTDDLALNAWSGLYFLTNKRGSRNILKATSKKELFNDMITFKNGATALKDGI